VLIHKVYLWQDLIEQNQRQKIYYKLIHLLLQSGSSTINVFEPSHGRTTGDIVVFRNVDGSPGALAYTLFENANGFSITVTGTDNYTFNLGSTPTLSGKFGGPFVTAGPVTLTP
jgi:hypothetical protein